MQQLPTLQQVTERRAICTSHTTTGVDLTYTNISIHYIYLENQNPKNSSDQHKNLKYFGKNKKTPVFD